MAGKFNEYPTIKVLTLEDVEPGDFLEAVQLNDPFITIDGETILLVKKSVHIVNARGVAHDRFSKGDEFDMYTVGVFSLPADDENDIIS